MLRVSGEHFNVDSFLNDCKIIPAKVYRKGERRFPNSTKNESICIKSGANFEISSADLSDLAAQINDVIAFFRLNHDWIVYVTSFSGVDDVKIDFGASIYPPGWASFTFPPELLQAISATNISLTISIYPCEDEVPE